MTETSLHSRLKPIALSYRRYRLWRGLTLAWTAGAVAGAGLILANTLIGWNSPYSLPLLLSGTALLALFMARRASKETPNYRWIARKIEQEHPKLNTLLLAALDQAPDERTGELTFLQDRVIREALEHNRREPWDQSIAERLFFNQFASTALLFVLITIFLVFPKPSVPSAQSAARVAGIEVKPGDTSVELGSGVVVLARFDRALPAEATLVLESSTGPVQRIPLAKNLEDPVFGGTIPEVKSDLKYRVEFGQERTRDYQITVFEYPSLVRADSQLTYPEYTKLPVKRIEDTRRVTAVEGTVLDYTFLLNKPVVSARLLGKEESIIPLNPDPTRANVYLANLTLEESRRYDLELIDDAGRTNRIPAEFVFEVNKNRAPELKFAFPRGDQRVSPLEEISFEAQVSDDFGLGDYGFAFTVAGEEPRFVKLGQGGDRNQKQVLRHLLALEEYKAEPDQLITYYVWAEDIGPDGQVRRGSSDMFFAEVRPFEEIFRERQAPQGENQGQQQGGQGNPATRLTELQKEIINATWKLQRRERVDKPSAKFEEDVSVIHESQNQALTQAEALGGEIEDEKSKSFVEKAVEEMKKASQSLSKAAGDNSPAPLPGALSAEQSAYQALLKLQAREYQVSRGGGQGGGGAGQRSQQQLDQLELSQSENRYETQRQASPQQTPERQEDLQLMNRLKDLARRQEDLNERLKELQTALQEAKTEEEKEAVRRQLKRLREEQQEMVRDIDELQQRMAQPENQSRMADSREQLEQTRSEAMRAAEELDQNEVSQALAAGTRAQRELQELRDDFRKKTSSQFSEDMQRLRSEARELAQTQEDLSRKMNEIEESKRKTLSDSDERKQIADGLQAQKKEVESLLNEMRDVTERAETAEPLLSKQLYDTIRQTDKGKLDNALDLSSQLVQRGFVPKANEFEQQAREGINQLKTGVERAAQSVLGDDVEALRLAKRELDALTEQVDREIGEATANSSNSNTNTLASANRPNGGRPGQTPSAADPNGSSNTNSQALAQGQRRPNGEQTNPAPSDSQSQQGTEAQQGEQGQQGQAQARSRAGRGASGAEPSEPGQDEPQTAQAAQAGQGQNGQGQRPGQGEQGEQGEGEAQAQGQGQRQQPGAGEAGNGGGGQQPGRRPFFDQAANAQGGGTGGPISGENFREWSDRLGDVEEMLDSPDLRNEVSRIRDRARVIRSEARREGKPPQWDLVRLEIAAPLAEVRTRVQEELARRQSRDALVPIDRDPVPAKFSELVRRYYEKLGSSE